MVIGALIGSAFRVTGELVSLNSEWEQRVCAFVAIPPTIDLGLRGVVGRTPKLETAGADCCFGRAARNRPDQALERPSSGRCPAAGPTVGTRTLVSRPLVWEGLGRVSVIGSPLGSLGSVNLR